MKKINVSRQEEIKNVVQDNSELITSVLEKLVKDKWTDLNPAQDIVKRLKRKGFRNSAEQFMKYYDEIKRKNLSLDDPQNGTADLIELEPKEINKLVREGISGVDDMKSSNFLHKGSLVARSVARIIDAYNREPFGTGFLVSPNLFMTNHHVISTSESALECLIQFDYVSDGTADPIQPVEFKLLLEKLFVTSPEDEYDYSLIGIESTNHKDIAISSFGWIKLIEELDKAAVGERLNIIHHPLGKPQQTSFRKNLLISHHESMSRLFYMTDTEEGSSGSPVLNDEWELVALHFGSQELHDEHQKELFFKHMYNKYIELAPEMHGKSVMVNVGMRVSAIVNSIKKKSQGLSHSQFLLIEELFEISNPGYKELSKNRYSEGIAEISKISERFNREEPLNININIGNRHLLDPNQVDRLSFEGLRSDNDNDLKTKLELFNKNIRSQKSVFNALLFLEEARQTKYLPSKLERNKRVKNYYGPIISSMENGLDRGIAYDKLNSLVSESLSIVDRFPDFSMDLENVFQNVSLESINLEGGVSYARARAHLYTWVDLHEDRMLRGVYTKMIIAPEQLLLLDLIKSLKLGVTFPRRYSNNQFLNCEHIVPQSLFNEDSTGVSDLHHLITAEGATNSFRSNNIYGILGNNGEEGPRNLPEYIPKGGRKKDGFFEPFNNKPLVARATLYFIVAHRNKLSKQLFNNSVIGTLIEWSNQKKPNRYELHRNESIYELQGNRNPFIDFPEWVNRIDFLLGLKT